MGADPAAEEQFGPYLVYERLGVGGMATVHRALERGIEGFERMVALKRLLPHLAEDASFIKSFVREAKLASILNHVNIVQIFELGRVGTEYFISMEYIDGRDIRRILRHARKVTGPPPIHITVGMLLQLCEALDYAHTKVDDDGRPLLLVHRDVSPSNVLVTSRGHLKIIDFGIAKAQSSQLRTQTGRVKGKLAYMAPEAISGSKDLDARSDLWAVGVIAHELLTARPLFASKNEYQTLLKVQRGDIMPPSTFNQTCPPEVDAIVWKALSRDPDQRFSTAGEMREELLQVRRQYQLQSGYRDIAAWLEWAFSLESPAGVAGNTAEGSGNADDPARAARRSTAQRSSRSRDEDEAVEMVWGTAEGESSSGPVVLDDVPDVSEKHLAASITSTKPEHDSDDDMPTPRPGEHLSSRGTNPNVNVVPRASVADAPPGRSGDEIAAERTTGALPAQPPAPRPHRSTAPGIAAARLSRPTASGLDPLSARRRENSSPPWIPRPRESVRPTTPPPARETRPPELRAPERTSREAFPRAESNATTDPTAQPITHTTEPRAQALAPAGLGSEDLFGPDQDDALETVLLVHDAARTAPDLRTPPLVPSTVMDDIASTQSPPPLPIVRFSTSRPPSNVPILQLRPTGKLTRARPHTDPGDAIAAVVAMRNRRSAELIGASPQEQHRPRRSWLLLLSIVIAGAAATGITLYVTRGQDSVMAVREPQPRIPAHVRLTVKFVTEPADSEIRIEGQVVHTGAPWSASLEPGVHQIEIRRAGYKSWLTSLELSASDGNQLLRVVLEPLGNGAASGDATLSVSSTPPDLDVVLDGRVLSQRTPIKVSIKPGPHSVAVRQTGVEVWHQSFTAETSVDYEYNPSFTEEKQRERSERALETHAIPAPGKTNPTHPIESIERETLEEIDAQKPEPTAPKTEPEPEAKTEPKTAPKTAPKTEPRTEPRTEPKTASKTEPKTEPRTEPKTEPKTAMTPDAPSEVKGEIKAQSSGPGLPKPPLASGSPPVPPRLPEKPSTGAGPPPARAIGPVTIPPPAAASMKLSGETPSIGKAKNADIPPIVAAKVCIDTAGAVSSVEALTKLDRVTKQGLVEGLMSWRYAPYKANGVATAACFVVTLRVK